MPPIVVHCTLGFETREVRCVDDLKGLAGLVLPGGESTTQIKLLNWFELWDPLHEFLSSGAPVLATCAGMILLAETVTNPAQVSYGLLDIEVSRNGWGRQVHSAEAVADLESTAPTFGRRSSVLALHPSTSSDRVWTWGRCFGVHRWRTGHGSTGCAMCCHIPSRAHG